MTKAFDQAAFRKRLIEKGTDDDMATDIAAKMAAAQLEAQQEAIRRENGERKETAMFHRQKSNADPAHGPVAVTSFVRQLAESAPHDATASTSQHKQPAEPKLTAKKRAVKRTSQPQAAKGTPKKAAPQLKSKTPAPVPDQAFKNGQLSLFQAFLANNDEQRDILSNAVDLWDNIPRYSMPRKRQEALREPGGYLPIRKISFQYQSIPLSAVIRPARLEARDEKGRPTGETVEYYPSAREELIEQALRRLATESGSGFLDGSQPRSGLYFTLYRLRQELASRGHAMTHRDLAEGLDVLSLSSIDIETGDQNKLDLRKFGRSTFIDNLAGVKREDLDRDPHARWYVEFHPFVTASIEKITYRQFNYDRWMRGRTQLARWLIAQLVLKYTQAALTHPFVMKYSTIKRDSGLLEGYKLERQAVAALDSAWEDLVRLNVLTSFQKEEQRRARAKLEDVSYTLLPTRIFASEQRAANKRQLNAKEGEQSSQQDMLV